MTNTDRRAGRKLLGALQLRMTADQQARIERRAEAREISSSAAARELLDLGGVLEDAGDRGLYVTEEALKLVAHGAAALGFGQYLDDDDLDWLADRGNQWTDADRDRLKSGAVLLASTEELAHMSPAWGGDG